MKQRRICLISPGHIASNPRLVKEANALHQAGYEVRVVVCDYMAAVRPLDATILSQAPWKYIQVKLDSKVNYLKQRFCQELARKVASTGMIPYLSIATWTHSPISYQLAQAAAKEPADLYIAHNLAALPAAAIASKKHNAKLGFDAEDFHVGQLCDTAKNKTEIAIRDYIERTLLPRCQHLTAASPGIAAAYAQRYGVSMQPILNVFPLREAPTLTNQENTHEGITREPSLYWFSQTIGAGRGLEAIIQAMGVMRTSMRLNLRGKLAAGYQAELMQLAEKVGAGDRIHFLPSAAPAKMAQLATYHDIGLSLEPGRDINNSICLGNKIFTYLLAGIPVLMSSTPAQKELAQHLKSAAVLIDINQPQDIATKLDKFFSNRENLKTARIQAQKLGRERYNWDLEKNKFLSNIEKLLT
ncbi:MAG: glycosyltransferase [Cyanobacteria bacterium J06632_19]